MPTVAIHAPRTPVTAGSLGVAPASVPNVCKTPAPLPLPNVGLSGKLPVLYTRSVTIERMPVAVQGASFGSVGDLAARLTGGGLVSLHVEGPTKFLGLGAPDVRIEGRSVQLLGDQMLNNHGPLGTPPNAATLPGIVQAACVVVP